MGAIVSGLSSYLARTIFHLVYSGRQSTVNIKFPPKEKSLTETAVFNIQSVYSGELLEMEKFSLGVYS